MVKGKDLIEYVKNNVEKALFNELDENINKSNVTNDPEEIERRITNKYLTTHQGDGNGVKKEKVQDPKIVDLNLRHVFNTTFKDYRLFSDCGYWKLIKVLNKDGKGSVKFENVQESSVTIDALFFPNDSNKVLITVNFGNEKTIDYSFEIYQIPTDQNKCERFIRKVFFNLLKKFIDTKIIINEPFNSKYVFWKTDNPFYTYSFSSPKKNKIVQDLIAFVNTAKHPILDDFFEQNNLKHKQGYLQTLLDACEAAGIFSFVREGNELLIVRGQNYKVFLEGRLRRVSSIK